jgi:hypothetical protein
MTRFAPLLLLALLLSACPEEPLEESLVGAPGVWIRSVSITQGVEHPLAEDQEAVESDVPLIAGRDALVRVFYATDEDYDGGQVTGRLTLGDTTIDWSGSLDDRSEEDDLDSTVNFAVDGELVVDPLSWSVTLLQEAVAEGRGWFRYPEEGAAETGVEGDVNVLQLVIAPFSYEFDGSGRLPDTSPEQIERIRQYFLKLYPVSDVEVRLRDPEPWDQELGSDGSGWTGPGLALLGYRNADDASDDVYYYGIFNPTETIQQFCFAGCLLGVTLLNDSPPDIGSPMLRLALGVGFAEEAPGIAAHEIGHAHGRPHTPCGPPGNVPADIDPDYPYPDGNIGIWGYDIVEGELYDPEDATDLMGYCDHQWVSDFTYRALHERGQNVNLGWASLLPAVTWDVIVLDGAGGAAWGASTRRRSAPGAPSVEATLLRGDGASASVRASWAVYDHIPGGWLLVPRTDFAADAVAFEVDGVRYEVALER